MKTLCIYADYKSDESYTPSKISVRVGNNFHNLQEIRVGQWYLTLLKYSSLLRIFDARNVFGGEIALFLEEISELILVFAFTFLFCKIVRLVSVFIKRNYQHGYNRVHM